MAFFSKNDSHGVPLIVRAAGSPEASGRRLVCGAGDASYASHELYFVELLCVLVTVHVRRAWDGKIQRRWNNPWSREAQLNRTERRKGRQCRPPLTRGGAAGIRGRGRVEAIGVAPGDNLISHRLAPGNTPGDRLTVLGRRSTGDSSQGGVALSSQRGRLRRKQLH